LALRHESRPLGYLHFFAWNHYSNTLTLWWGSASWTSPWRSACFIEWSFFCGNSSAGDDWFLSSSTALLRQGPDWERLDHLIIEDQPPSADTRRAQYSSQLASQRVHSSFLQSGHPHRESSPDCQPSILWNPHSDTHPPEHQVLEPSICPYCSSPRALKDYFYLLILSSRGPSVWGNLPDQTLTPLWSWANNYSYWIYVTNLNSEICSDWAPLDYSPCPVLDYWILDPRQDRHRLNCYSTFWSYCYLKYDNNIIIKLI